jgi:CheY-like chemotaxis protein
MFTSSLGQRNVAECYAKGANHFLRKPTSFSRLQEVIRSLYLSVLHNTPEPIIDLREYIPDPRGPVVCPT